MGAQNKINVCSANLNKIFAMRTEKEIREKLIEELNSFEAVMQEGIDKVRKTRDDSELESHLRNCADINERIMTLRWVLEEVSEL